MSTIKNKSLIGALTLAIFTQPAMAADATGNSALTDGSASTERRVTIAYINDLHAQLEPHAELFWSDDGEEYVENVGGFSRIATLVNELRAARPGEVLFVDGGDTIQGSGPAAWTEGQVVVEPLNALGLDLAIPGNWSVAYGAQAWRQRAEEFNYSMIAANMLDLKTGKPLFEPYLIKEINGVRIGMIGFTEPEIGTRQPPHLSAGLSFQAEEVLQPLVDELREERNVDVVVLATHIGLPKAVALAENLEGVDIHLSSDTHERTYEPIVRGDSWVVEAGAFGSFVGLLELTIDSYGDVSDRSWRLVELRPEVFPEDPEVKRIVDEALAPHRQRMDRVIGHTDVWLARYEVLNATIDNLIAPAIREATGADVALSNGFRFAPPSAPGPLTVADLWTWLPLNLELKTGLASGAQILEYWETELENVFSRDPNRLFGGWLPRCDGITCDFKIHNPAGERLQQIEVDGEPIDPNRMYTLAAGHREGAPEGNVHRVQGCELTRTIGMTTHDAVERYLKLHSPIRSDGRFNVRCLDCPGILRSQYLDQMGG